MLRNFGTTGLKVTALGFGAGHIGDDSMSEREVSVLLNRVVDEGVNLIDTARGYGRSEERIGRHLQHRRGEIVISTKVGYGISGVPDWTYDAVLRGVEEALLRLRTDRLDIVHLHSCGVEVLNRHEVSDALQLCVEEGKVGVAAYSGDNADLDAAIQGGRFRSLQASVNLFDQRFMDSQLPAAKERGMGVIAKRPLGNAPWLHKERPKGDYCEPYWERMQALRFDFGIPWDELALRFIAWTWGIDSCIVGTANPDRIRRNLEHVRKGPLPEDVVQSIRRRFRECDQGWMGQT